ncbi:Spc97/Spc98 spindle pole body-like protein [Hamiltosporidium tvaerminnensis]|uniref:Spindle pole body component n=1 Tax=Hamiltosporidium tvaerminnensis TaxID=1176355 RepID=A0A4Q9LRY6_9MICR|nr:Spc97/Spc98 spindle pole body-like protein [Hamiltosporidium tvaerminnensis]
MENLLSQLILEYYKTTKKNTNIDQSLLKYLSTLLSLSPRIIPPDTLSILSPITFPIPTNSLSQIEIQTFYFLLKISQFHPKKTPKISTLNIKKIALGINTYRGEERITNINKYEKNTNNNRPITNTNTNNNRPITNTNTYALDAHVIERASYYGKIYKELKYHPRPTTITHQYFYKAIEDILQTYENIVLSYNNDQPILIFHTLMYVAYNRLEALNQICQCYKDNTEDSFSFLRYLNINLLKGTSYLYDSNDTFYNRLISPFNYKNMSEGVSYKYNSNNTLLDRNKSLKGVTYSCNTNNTPLNYSTINNTPQHTNIYNNTYTNNFPPLNIILQKITLYTSIRTNTLLSSWLYTGTFIDPTSEFFIKVNSLENNTWHKFSINTKKVPYFISPHCINNILYIGRCINLIKEVSKNKNYPTNRENNFNNIVDENIDNRFDKNNFNIHNYSNNYSNIHSNNHTTNTNNINILDSDFEETINKILLQINRSVWSEIFINSKVLSFVYFLKDIFMFKRSDFVQNLFEMLKEWNVDKYGVSYKRSVGFILDTSLGVTFGNECPFIKYMDVCLLEQNRGISRDVGINDKDKGVNDKGNKQQGVSNSTDKQHPVNYNNDKQQGVSNSTDKQQGVNNIYNKQHPVNYNTDKQQGVNNVSNKQHPVNYNTDKQQGVSNSTDKQYPVNNTLYEQHPVINSTFVDSDSLITNSVNTTILENNNNINNTPLDNTWDYLTLLCVIDFPLNMIINKKTILRFSTIFKFLWKVKKVERILGSLKKRKLDKNSLNRIHFYYCFVQSFMFYCCEEVISIEWSCFLRLECFEENLYENKSKNCRYTNVEGGGVNDRGNLEEGVNDRGSCIKGVNYRDSAQQGVSKNIDKQHPFNNSIHQQHPFNDIYHNPSINNSTLMNSRLIESFKDGLLDLTGKIIERGYMTGRMKEKLFLFFSELEALSVKVGRTGQPFDDFGVKKCLREFYIELGSRVENTGLFIYKKYL